jgi:O-antigen/teichoic acid export membrane protein
MSGRRTSVLRSAALTVGMRWTDRLLGLISTLVLARLLVPADIGVVAMCSLVIGLIDVLLDLGVGTALIRNPQASAGHYHTAWSLRLAQMLAGAAIVVATAPLAARYFGDPRLIPVLYAMSLGLVLAGLENIGVIDFQKEMRFGADFKFTFMKRVAGFIVTLVLASLWRSYWALVVGSLVGRFVGVVLSYVMHPLRPRLEMSRFKDIFAISQWMLVRNTGAYINASLHRILVGGRDTASVMGGYSIANEIAAMPATELLAPLNRVLFPTFVHASADHLELKRVFLLAQGVQTLVAFPASVGLAMVANEAVPVLLGQKWAFAIPFVQLLAVGSMFQAITTSGGYVLITLAKMRESAMVIWVQAAVFAAIAFLAIPDGHALELAWARIISGVGAVGLMLWLLLRVMPQVRMADVARTLARPFVATGVMIAALWLTERLVALAPAPMLAVKIVIGVVVYPATIVALWRLAGMPDGAEAYLARSARGAWEAWRNSKR